MGEFYITDLDICLNSCKLERFFLYSTSLDIFLKCTELYSALQNIVPEVVKPNIMSLNSRSGIIRHHKNAETDVISQSFLFDIPTRLTVCMDGYAASLFLLCLNSSHNYVELVTQHMACQWSMLLVQNSRPIRFKLSKMLIKLLQPQGHVMDLLWAKMACITIHELRQLQYAMSWLSTLGGAFSALGEEQERCAKAAGAISIEQLRIALKLGDKIVITQCKLYFSLSLIQRGYCKLAKKIILQQYNALKDSIVVDRKTLNMCKGIWARLKYELQKRRKLKESMTKQGSNKSMAENEKSVNYHPSFC